MAVRGDQLDRTITVSSSDSGSISSCSLNSSDEVLLGEEYVDGGNERFLNEQLSSLPPLAIISSTVKKFDALVKLANPGVATIHYNYQSTTLTRLLQYIRDRLKGRKAYCICFVTHGHKPGNFKLNFEKTVTQTSLKEDKELRDFFTELVSSFLYTGSDLARIDILNSPVEGNADGKQLVQDLSRLVGVPVYTSKDIWGAEVSFGREDGSNKIGTLYFDGQRLKEWYLAGNEMKLDMYEKIRVVGKGAYGQAVLYRRKNDDFKVILKKIRLLDLKKQERKNVLTEIEVLSMLDHPHIVSYYDSFEESGEMMIEMEYAEGGSLQQYLKGPPVSPLPELEVLTKFSQMVDAIRYIHKHNILHRDLKTANIFLTRAGLIKLGDFGIAKVLSTTQEAADTMVGTPYYISPEICEAKHYNAKTDIWSLGCILYEMLCLHKTFDGTNLPALINKIVEGSFEPIKGLYSTPVKKLVKKMLEKNPSNRPSAEQLHLEIVPALLKRIQDKEIPPPTDLLVQDDLNTRSFLYYLDGSNFLLKPVAYPFQQKIINISIGFSHIVAVTDDLDVYSWGDNSHGQLGLEDLQPRTTPALVKSLNSRNIKSAQCGGEFTIFMNENGIIMSCGRGDKGMLGHGNTEDSSKPDLIKELLSHDACMIECGESHVVMLTKDGKIFVWGSGDCGRLGIGSGDDCLKPTEVEVHSPGTRMKEIVRNIRCGSDSTVFITDVGRVFACGNNADNKLGLNKRVTFLMQMTKLRSKNQLEVPCCSVPTPIKELGKHRVVDCFIGVTHSVFLTESRLIYTFGRNSEAQLGTGHCHPMDMPNIVKGLNPKPMIVKSMEFATIVASERDSFYIWGSRPVVRSPLHHTLSGDKEGDIYSPATSPDSGFKGSPLRRVSPPSEGVGDISPSHTDPMKGTNNDSNQSSPKVRHKGLLEAQLAEVPHELIPCTVATKYTQTIHNYSNRHSVGNKQVAKIPRQISIASTYHNNKITKKGSRESMEKITVTSDGKILSPVSIDLVQESKISVDLWSQGYENIKLEDISCYGPNLVVLIYATLKEKSSSEKQRKESITVGMKLRHRTAFDLLPDAIKPLHPGNLDGVKEMTEEEDNGQIAVKGTPLERPMSPTGQLPTWLKADLKEGIPMSGDVGVDKSHGWFPKSFSNALPCHNDNNSKQTTNQKLDGTKVLTRRPSGTEPSVMPVDISSDIPIVMTSPTHQSQGINQLPTTEGKQEVNMLPTRSKLSGNGSILQHQAKSIAYLPQPGSMIPNIKRVQSSQNVTKSSRDKSVAHKNVRSKVTASDLTPPASSHHHPSVNGRLQKSYTTPGRLEDSDKMTAKKPSTKKTKSNLSPYEQPVMKVKPTVKPPNNALLPYRQDQNKKDSHSAVDRKANEEMLKAAFEKEKQELREIINEKSENEHRLEAELNKLVKKVEADQQQFDQFKQKLSELEKEQARVREEAENKKKPQSKICVIM